MPYKITTPEMSVRIIKSTDPVRGLKIDDYLSVTGNSDVDGSCSVGGSLNVVGNSLYNGTLSVRTPAQTEANLQNLTSDDYNECSIGYYNRVDEQATVAGDIWTSGINCYSKTGYTIGTNGSNTCFNIQNNGVVTVDYRLVTPLLYATNIRASNATVSTLNDDATITGSFTSTKPWTATTGNINLTDTTGNYIYWNTSGLSGPTFGSRSAGTKLVLFPQVTTAACDYAIGVESGILWFSTLITSQMHRFYCGNTVVLDISSTSFIVPGKIYQYQPMHTASTTAGMTALSLAHLVNGIYQTTQTVAITLPLPVGTAIYGGGFGTNQSLDWSVINTGTVAAGTTTVQQNTNHTLVGSGLVSFGTSGRFRTKISALNTAVTYRLA